MTQVALTTVASERVQFTELCGTLTRSREANEGKQSIFCARERGARGKKGNGGLKGRSNDGCRECQMVDQPRCHSTVGLLLLLEKTHTLCHYYGALWREKKKTGRGDDFYHQKAVRCLPGAVTLSQRTFPFVRPSLAADCQDQQSRTGRATELGAKRIKLHSLRSTKRLVGLKPIT